MIINYLPNTDTYYIPDKELYIKRYMFLYADAGYLAHVIGLDGVDTRDRDAVFILLGREEDNRPDQYVIEFHDK